MIRDKSILLKLKSESSDEILLRRALRRLRPSRMRCPHCHSLGGHKRVSSYKRMMITVVDGKRCEKEVDIPVCKCTSCSRTNAVLPDVLIPFGSYTLRFILTVLRSYLDRNCSVCSLCSFWQISISTLYGWIHLFSKHYSAWAGILLRIRWAEHKSLDAVEESPAFPSAFFSRFGFSFLQNRQTSRSHPVAPDTGGL